MNSDYAYAHFIEGIGSTDESIDGELVQVGYSISEGETNLMPVWIYEQFKNYFPDRIKGGIIKQDNLVNMINLLYSRLKVEIAELPELDSYVSVNLESIKDRERNGSLKTDSNTKDSINDLAAKLISLQEQVRRVQRENVAKSYRSR